MKRSLAVFALLAALGAAFVTASVTAGCSDMGSGGGTSASAKPSGGGGGY